MPEFRIFPVSEINDALNDIRNKFLTGKELVWTGPDDLHYSISAGSPKPSWHFSEEGMESHEEQGRGFWDVYNMIAVQLGLHNGIVKESKTLKIYEETIKSLTKKF